MTNLFIAKFASNGFPAFTTRRPSKFGVYLWILQGTGEVDQLDQLGH